MKETIFFLFFITISLIGNSQGRTLIIDSSTKQGIPFASIKVKLKPEGYYTDANGIVYINKANLDDTVMITCVGYQNLTTVLNKISFNNAIALLPKVDLLNDITVHSNTVVNTIDYPAHKKTAQICSYIPLENVYKIKVPTKDSGRIIKVLTTKIKLKKANKNNPCRLHIYNLGKDGYPNEEMLKKDILITNDNVSKGEFVADISRYNITTNDGALFIGFEWLGKIEKNDKREGPIVEETYSLNEANTYSRTILDKDYKWVLSNQKDSLVDNFLNILVSITYQ